MPPRIPISGISLYETLGVRRGASPPELKRAYHRALLANHPDKVGDSVAANDHTGRIVDAYNILSDPAQRMAYDRTLNQPLGVPKPSPPMRAHYSVHTPGTATSGPAPRAAYVRPAPAFAMQSPLTNRLDARLCAIFGAVPGMGVPPSMSSSSSVSSSSS